jgi:hypothetical protein
LGLGRLSDELSGGIPLARDEHLFGAFPHGDRGDQVTTDNLHLDKINLDGDLWIGFQSRLQCDRRGRINHHARNPEGDTVAKKDFGKALTNDALDAPFGDRLGRMFTTGTTAEIAIDHKQDGILVLRLVKGMLAVELLAIVGKDMFPEAIEGDAFEETGWNDPIGVNVVTNQRNSWAGQGHDLTGANWASANWASGEIARHGKNSWERRF